MMVVSREGLRMEGLALKGDCDSYRGLEVMKHSCEALEGPRVNASADVLLNMALSQPLLAMT